MVNMEIPVQRDLRGVQSEKNKTFDEKKNELLDQTQDYMYSQSSKFSSVSRTLVFGVIGTIWFLIYTDGRLSVPNICLFISLVLGLIFLLVDVIHYYLDSVSYQDELYQFDEYKTQYDLDKKHEDNMNYINRRSHRFIVAKFWILIIVSASFLFGMMEKIPKTIIDKQNIETQCDTIHK